MLYVVIDWENQSIELLRWLDTSRSRRNVPIPILIFIRLFVVETSIQQSKTTLSLYFGDTSFISQNSISLHYYETTGRKGQLPNWVTKNGRSWVFAFSGALDKFYQKCRNAPVVQKSFKYRLLLISKRFTELTSSWRTIRTHDWLTVDKSEIIKNEWKFGNAMLYVWMQPRRREWILGLSSTLLIPSIVIQRIL